MCDIGGHRRQDLLKVARQANHGRLIKQIGRIFQPPHQTVVGFSQRQRQIKLAAALRLLNERKCQPGQFQRLSRGVVQRQHDLEDRAVTQAAGRLQCFHHLFERQVLMGIGRQCAFANLSQQFRHGVALAGFNTQGQRIGEETN